MQVSVSLQYWPERINIKNSWKYVLYEIIYSFFQMGRLKILRTEMCDYGERPQGQLQARAWRSEGFLNVSFKVTLSF